MKFRQWYNMDEQWRYAKWNKTVIQHKYCILKFIWGMQFRQLYQEREENGGGQGFEKREGNVKLLFSR